MQKRGFKLESTKCLFCGRVDEDGAHLFIKCKAVKKVWRELALEEEKNGAGNYLVCTCYDGLSMGLAETKRMHILTFWWLWWSARNKLRKGELVASADELARRTRSYVLDYMQAFLPPAKKICADKWRPPQAEMVKINVDGAFVPGDDHAGWGAVVRTMDGAVVGARARRQEHVQDASCCVNGSRAGNNKGGVRN